MKKLLDGIALLVIFFGCIFEFILSYFSELIKNGSIEPDKEFVAIHIGLMMLSAMWLFIRAMNNWERE